MKLAGRLQQLPLHYQWMGVLVALSMATTAVTVVTLTSLSGHRLWIAAAIAAVVLPCVLLLAVLASAFSFMARELHRVSTEHERRVATERERLESVVAERTQALERSREMFRLIAESTKAIPFTLDVTRGAFPYIGAQAVADFNVPEGEWGEAGALDRVIPRDVNPEIRQCVDDCAAGPFEFLAVLQHSNGPREVRWMGTCELKEGVKSLRGLILDVTEVRRLGRELAAAQKLESVGRLAAGVAHEINTPIQFVADNVGFVSDSIAGIAAVIQAHRELKRVVKAGGNAAASARAADAAEIEADFDYLIENVPPAIAGAIEGLERIATIARSMKEFAHPDQSEKTFVDLNHAIESTLIIARNEYRYVAELETGFGDLPPVQCHLGEINQVVLNLVVNAAHAIADVVSESGAMGRLTVRTRLDGGEVEISIGDTGTGIPEAARAKIFDPFFTTKELGKGTGQGLAMARSVVVNKHGGTLRFETECGKGTTFFIRLPVGTHPDDAADQAAA